MTVMTTCLLSFGLIGAAPSPLLAQAVATQQAAAPSADEIKQRVTAALAPTYEKPFSVYGEYRRWRTGLAANIERTFAMVS